MKETRTTYSYLIEHMKDPSFRKIRELACDFVRKLPSELCDELHNSLNRGVDVLDSEPLLQMYFYSFGDMHKAKLDYAFDNLHGYIKEANRVELIDYGCGQGLATMCYHDYISNVNPSQIVTKIILIEPSEMAMSRAELLCSAFYPNAKIIPINRGFDKLSSTDIELSNDIPTIHLFSNILDVESFDIEQLAHIIKNSSKGHNEYVIVSPIQNNRRIQRLKTFSNILDNRPYFEKYLDKREFRKDKEWTCAVLLCSTSNEYPNENYEKLYGEAIYIIKNKIRDEKCQLMFHKLYVAALSGNVKCQNALGLFYKSGIGTHKDEAKAFEWFSKSSEDNFPPAISNLANCYYKGIGTDIDYNKAYELFMSAKALDYLPSYNKLANCFMNGKGVEKDIDKAVKLLKYAADKNDARAQVSLGACYLDGLGVEKDYSKAIYLIKASSEKGFVGAYWLLGKCYREGLGVNVNIPEAIKCYTKAGLLEHKRSIIALIEIFEKKDYKNLFGDEQFDALVKGVHLGIPEISRVTVTWLDREPEEIKDGDVIYGSNSKRVLWTIGRDLML